MSAAAVPDLGPSYMPWAVMGVLVVYLIALLWGLWK